VGLESQLTASVGEAKLVIVRRGHFATFELLTRTFAGDPSVQIIWDRRMGERRRTVGERGENDRRRRDRRRVPSSSWNHLDYIIATETTA
jgi:hypothetical protein